MKKWTILFGILISIFTFSQDLPTEFTSGFSFPLGAKFTIKLKQIDSLNFDYSITKYESYDKIIDSMHNDELFEEDKELDGTIDFYFGIATYGDNDAQKENNKHVVLMMKNWTPFDLDYISDIVIQPEGEFQNTSNIGTHSKVLTTEEWPYMIYEIAISEFTLGNL